MRRLILFLSTLSAACGVNVEAPYLLNDLKVVSIVANPPDIVAGAVTQLTATIAAPKNPAGPVVTGWSVCREHGTSATNPTCSDPLTLQQSPPQQLAAGIFAVNATLTADPAWIVGIPDAIMQAGYWVYTTIAVDAPKAVTAQARKRIVLVAANVPPNHNPVLRKVDVWVAGTHVSSTTSVAAGDTLELSPDIDTTTFEAYRVLASDGSLIPRLETAELTWYVTSGNLSNPVTRGDRSVLWSLPRNVGGTHQQYVVVLRDARGGQASWVGEVAVR